MGGLLLLLALARGVAGGVAFAVSRAPATGQHHGSPITRYQLATEGPALRRAEDRPGLCGLRITNAPAVLACTANYLAAGRHPSWRCSGATGPGRGRRCSLRRRRCAYVWRRRMAIARCTVLCDRPARGLGAAGPHALPATSSLRPVQPGGYGSIYLARPAPGAGTALHAGAVSAGRVASLVSLARAWPQLGRRRDGHSPGSGAYLGVGYEVRGLASQIRRWWPLHRRRSLWRRSMPDDRDAVHVDAYGAAGLY
jgi:hypothetical protein